MKVDLLRRLTHSKYEMLKMCSNFTIEMTFSSRFIVVRTRPFLHLFFRFYFFAKCSASTVNRLILTADAFESLGVWNEMTSVVGMSFPFFSCFLNRNGRWKILSFHSRDRHVATRQTNKQLNIPSHVICHQTKCLRVCGFIDKTFVNAPFGTRI